VECSRGLGVERSSRVVRVCEVWTQCTLGVLGGWSTEGMSECVGCSVAVVTAMLIEGGDGVPKIVWGLMMISCESLVVVVFECYEQGGRVVKMWMWVRCECSRWKVSSVGSVGQS
jgi:hypothetical protein